MPVGRADSKTRQSWHTCCDPYSRSRDRPDGRADPAPNGSTLHGDQQRPREDRRRPALRQPEPRPDHRPAGSHPIETGVGAAVGGIASGAAVGAVGGPVGAVVGGIVGGALAGGLAGKGVGELVDPTTEDNWLREYFHESGTKADAKTTDSYRSAYKYGTSSVGQHSGKRFEDVETHLRSDWESTHAKTSGLGWDQARGAVRHAFDRTIQLHEERMKVNKQQVQTGELVFGTLPRRLTRSPCER
jgi:hypothetical protein